MHIPVHHYWKLLARYLFPQWPQLLALALALFGGMGLSLLGPQLAALFIDMATTGKALSSLVIIAVLFCLVGFGSQGITVLTLYLGSNVGWKATNTLRADLIAHCLRLDMTFHHAHTPGEMIERTDGDVDALSNFFSQFAVQLLGNILLILGVLAVLLLKDWHIGLAFLLFTVLALLVFHRVRNVAAPFWGQARQTSADLYGFLEERLSGINDIRANGANPYIKRRFTERIRQRFHANRKAIAMGVIVGNGSELILTLGLIGALAVAITLYLSGTITIGSVYLITAYAALMNQPLQQIIGQIDDLQQATASITRVEELFQQQPVITDGRGVDMGAGALSVAFTHVSFRYAPSAGTGPTDEVGREEEAEMLERGTSASVLSDVSFHLAPGEILGLVGRTGSGKTTMIRLLLRLYDPDTGHISLNGVDLRDLRLEALRSRIGIVTQDVHLFHASVRDNLTLFDHSVSDEQILAILRELGLDAWYEHLPQGLDTILPAGGGGLSAGEAQLLAAVRVFLKDPGLIILDEASSRLDPLTERLLERAFDRLLVGRTAIIIAHRLRTIQRANTILLLERGSLKEYGPREKLANDPQSTFHHLLQMHAKETLEQVAVED